MDENETSVLLIRQSRTALDNLASVTGIINQADLINRAILVYNYVATIQDQGNEIYIGSTVQIGDSDGMSLAKVIIK